ncbi:Otubain-1 [Hyphodiscus hymeniophilus]|uniref:ubiquitinyl hydrolase 1 n=1 Tax=Hyphodiscus hymeniophilus TaxID=353542 RepID=A0A9P6VL60_9HELO|nr:Otubain-1 [Hyphodiscus hymeniophilus]
MFQPQPTPYSPFSSYGAVPEFHIFQQSQSGRSGLAVDSGGPTIVQNPIFTTAANGNPSSNIAPALNFSNNTSTSTSTSRFEMAENNFDDLERQEELARSFQPNLQGSLVGEKRSSHAITEAYAKADPVYVAKTAALPQKYSHYRPVLGDGNCGWRATGFAYFETLLRLQDKAQLEEEIARMTSLNNLIARVGGFDAWMFEDMVEETVSLLRDMADSIETSPQTAEEILMQRFNESDISNNIVYHLRLLASSFLKSSPSSYQDFIPDNLGVEAYSKEWIEPPNQEIDHLGMTLLIDVLLKPIGFAVEIVYLDRSEGSQVNSHLMQPEDENGVPTNPSGPIIHLLYRPSHYDILYKDMDSSMPLQQALHDATLNPNIQVNRATSFSQQHAIQSTSMNDFTNLDLTSLLNIPGFQCAPPSHHGFPAQFHSPIEQPYAPSPISTSISPVSPGASSNGTSSNTNLSLSTNFSLQQSSALTSPAVNISHSSHAPFPPQNMQIPIHPGVPQQQISPHPGPPSIPTHPSISSQHSDLPSPTSANSPFRPSKWEWGARVTEQEGPVVFQTSTFKNSHYNTAHYNNPNFQPEEWSPECEEASNGHAGGGGGRKRST